MIGAIAAGCTVVVKPSELSVNCGKILADLFPRYLDPAAFRVVLGGVTQTTHLLELKWNHIFFTGSNRVGRIIAASAAKHVTPVTLELGGKCPVYVDTDTDMSIAARRILWGKQQNTGQVRHSCDQ
jgi:aldehyde dehydrogenase (NAD+)